MNPLFNDTVFSYETLIPPDKLGNIKRSAVIDVHNEYQNKYGECLPKFTKINIDIARNKLQAIMMLDRPFVALHVRDSGFYGDYNRTTRSADVKTYELAIRYLIDKGYTVVRVGHHSADPIDDMVLKCGSFLIDYARSEIRSDFLDCYLTTQCAFYLGGTSGLWSIPMIFGVPSCVVNAFTPSTMLGLRAGDLTTFKKFRYKIDNNLVPFEKLFQFPFTLNPQRSQLENLGYYLEDNTAEEILDTVKEFVERPSSKPSALQTYAKKQILLENYSYNACGDYSETILKQYYTSTESPQ